jgi:imidazolonepropionase-like amidohydrolase
MSKDRLIAFDNVRIFDGKDLHPSGGVLVSGNRMEAVSTEQLEVPSEAIVIDGGGRVLSPGFIATHEHLLWSFNGSITTLDEMHWSYVGALGVVMARRWLDWGFTTVRSAGGADIGLKKAIDEGFVPGPRVFPSMATLSSTGGHGDWRHFADPHPNFGGSRPPHETLGHTIMADGVADITRAAREQMRQGATQLKLMGSGGISSVFDPIDMHGFTEEEYRAAVAVAEQYGTYCMAHTYMSHTTQSCLKAGVRSIEHGMLCDEDTFKMMADSGAYLSTQAYPAVVTCAPENVPPMWTGERREKAIRVHNGFANMVEMATKHDVQVTWSTDLCQGQSAVLAVPQEWTVRSKYWGPLDILRQATSHAAELVELCGARNPYGRLGVIEKGALADLVLFEGDPSTDITMLSEPKESLRVIMKDGRLHKNNLEGSMWVDETSFQEMLPTDIRERLSEAQLESLTNYLQDPRLDIGV